MNNIFQTDKDWLQKLKVGDEVVIDSSRYGVTNYEIAVVEKVNTKTIRVQGELYYKTTGFLRGGSSFSGNFLVPCTPELKQQILDEKERKRLIRYIKTNIEEEENISLVTLRKISILLHDEKVKEICKPSHDEKRDT